jgi:2'-phosphotransferase
MERTTNLTNISKKLSWALRHGIKDLHLTMNPAGYVKLFDLLSHPKFKSISQNQVETIVKSCEKQRFDLKEIEGELMIRANQGHTVPDVKEEELLTPLLNPWEFATVLHGTNKSSWNKIKYRGLYRMNRNHIHFAVNLPGNKEVISGARVNCEVFIFIDLEKCLNDGMKFFISQNRVVLSSGFQGFISPEYFSKVLIQRVEHPLSYSPIDFDYFLVLDFEANCVEHGSLPCQEIIEFPVQVLNLRTRNVDFSFHKYVQPEVVPELSQFCTGLTGIRQEIVSGQIGIRHVLNEFQSFLM